ncbi:hypothetical protein ACE6H2_015491 [Prunus campanulata]
MARATIPSHDLAVEITVPPHGRNRGATSRHCCHSQDRTSFPRPRQGCPPGPRCSHDAATHGEVVATTGASAFHGNLAADIYGSVLEQMYTFPPLPPP